MQTTFLEWMQQQADRNDPVGDLAQDMAQDQRRMWNYFGADKLPNPSLSSLHSYINIYGACSEALNTLIAAYREWQSLGHTYRTTRDQVRRAGWLKLRFIVLKRDNYRCQLCGRTPQDNVKLEVDHKIARARGGSDTESNLWILCFDCNRGKRDSAL